MSDKKPYTSPVIFRVELNHEQAILSVCATQAASLSNTGSPGFCHSSGSCKRGTSGGSSNNAGRPS